MTKNHPITELNITREQMIHLLNEDLAGEYQAIIAYLVFKHVLKDSTPTDITRELEAHAGEELAQAVKIARQIDYPGGIPAVTPKKEIPTMRRNKSLGWISFRRPVPPIIHGGVLPYSEAAPRRRNMSVGIRADRDAIDFSNPLSAGRQQHEGCEHTFAVTLAANQNEK